MAELIAHSAHIGPDQPTLTLVVAAYMHENYIADCLSRITGTLNNRQIELIVIDDNSTDKTIKIACDLLNNENIFFKIFKSEKNRGLTFSLYFGLKIATCKHIFFIGSDDLVITHSLDNILSRLKNDMKIETLKIYSSRYLGDMSGSVYNNKKMLRIVSNPYLFYRWVSTSVPKPLLLQSTIFNTDFLRRCDPWTDQLLLDDWPTFVRASRLALAERKVCSFGADLEIVEYRVHSGGLHRNFDRHMKACFETVQTVISPQFSRQAKSSLCLDFSVAHFARSQYIYGMKMYIRALFLSPNLKTIVTVPTELFRGILRRIVK